MKYMLVILICVSCLSTSAYCPGQKKPLKKSDSQVQLVDKINFANFILI
jgi:hypothetical protein